MSILDYFTKNKEGKAKEAIVKIHQKRIMGLYLGKSVIASKTHLIYTLKLKREKVMYKEEEKTEVGK